MHDCIKILGAFGVLCLLMISSVVADSDGTVWNPFGEGVPINAIDAIEVYQGDLVAAGYPSMVDGDTMAAISRWDGSTWHQMGQGSTHWIRDLIEYEGQLIALGTGISFGETDPDTLFGALAWDGTAWVDMGFGPQGEFEAGIIWNDKLVIGGWFDTVAGIPANGVAIWDGATISALGEGLVGRVQALIEFEGDIIAGGDFYATGDGTPVRNIARWNGVSWEQIGDGFSHYVSALIVYDGKLTAAGRFVQSGTEPVSRVAAWDGSSWSQVGDGTDIHIIYDLAEFQGELIASGFVNEIRRFDGTNWHTVVETWGDVKALDVFEGNLVAAGKDLGTFYEVPLNNIAWRSSFDQDSDGVYDISDNCIWAENPGQENADGDLSGDVCDDCYGCESSVYLHHVSGLKGGDTVYAGTPVRFYFAVSGFPEETSGGFGLGFNMHSPDGAIWDIPVLDTVKLGWFEDPYLLPYFPTSGVTGSESDLLGFAVVSLMGEALPVGYHDVVFYIETEFSPDQQGKTICIDSASSAEIGNWVMVRQNSQYMLPYWDGPHCFTIHYCCQGTTGDIAGDNGEVDVTDIGRMVDYLFLSLAPLACESSANINYPGSGYPVTDEIVDIVDLQLLIDNQFLTLSPLSPCP